MRLWVRTIMRYILLTRIFKDRRERTGHLYKSDALPISFPYLRVIRFQGKTYMLKRKENSSLSTRWCFLGYLCYHILSMIGSGILTWFPFDKQILLDKRIFSNGIFLSLRIDLPMINYCSHGTFLHFSLQSSHLNICYYHQDLHYKLFQYGSRRILSTTYTPSYTLKHTKSYDMQNLVIMVKYKWLAKRHPFSGLIHSAGKLLHTS
jgi:hypothetical protein